MSKGFLLVISGPSGAGKGTVCRRILERNKKLVFSVSATTRLPRRGEKEGVNYFFVDEEKFNKMIEDGDFLEYANVHGNLYGTPKKFVLDQIEEGNIVILEIDVQGALQVKQSYPEAVFVFLLPPSMSELKNRIRKRRTESEDDIDLRFKNAFEELKFVDEYDYIVINDEVIEAVQKIEIIIEAEKLKVKRLRNIIDSIMK
ncbi:guanylate kinase [Tepidimicrobium xylanilyticum]|uniref:guanylate kinase n=1 Tax=Tepidimicrobium xylanilyticum TaxID=1123352 RepID=UPI00264EC876|nr:guanylate kinase [Tepidimicrobium xylanilyticum]GMG97198.1 guanylate kinase [Tepidimicrobium xylanilyticum]